MSDVSMKGSGESFGVLILGMHRSGTSALSAAFAAAGFDPGARLVGGSTGNEEGHWEDQFAVDLHDSLLGRFGSRWDLPFGLPLDWRSSDAAREAMGRIRAYLRDNRARHPLWVMKDPRACLFASLWTEALAVEGMPFRVVLAARHPLAVAQSLHRRDGISETRAMALWLDYTLSALEASDGDALMVDYDRSVADVGVLRDRLAGHLPAAAAEALASPAFAAVLDPSRRHHSAQEADLPGTIQAVWRFVSARTGSEETLPAPQPLEIDDSAWLDWLHRESRDREQFERRLWERVGRAEGALASWSQGLGALPEGIRRIEGAIQENRRVVDENRLAVEEGRKAIHEGLKAIDDNRKAIDDNRKAIDDGRELVVRVFSDDIRRMQELLLARDAAVARLEGQQAIAEQLLPRIETLQASLEAQGHVVRDLMRGLEEARRENATLAFHNQRLAETARQFDQLVQSRSWRWTRPLRALARLVTGQWTSEDTRRLRGGLSVNASPAANVVMELAAASAPVVLAPMQPGLPDVFIWGVIDWHFRFQRPQHLAVALARKGHRVFYVSNNTLDSASAGFDAEALDSSGRLFQVRLNLAGAPPIYFGMPGDAELQQLRASLAELLGWTMSNACISLVQHPFWTHTAQALPNHRLVYDCMDHHAGFDNTGDAVLRAEAQLVAAADLTVVSSAWLEAELADKARSIALIRNAGDHAFFAEAPKQIERDARGRPVIGYFGAIAEWFDVDLVRAVAEANPGSLVRLVGADTAGVGRALADLPNVELTGEVPYTDLPRWLHGFDVCLLPFKVIPLTLATNPVKVYEYLAAGKPIVAVALPEMAQFAGLVRTAENAEEFLAEVASALASADDREAAEARRAFAATQTWAHRAEALDAEIGRLDEPVVSVIVLTYNNLAFTEACLSSLELYSDYRHLEVIVVDNASSDGSPEWLRQWVDSPSPAGHRRRLILNDRNLGFAAGNNVGLAAASGELLVILNNDTYVTPGWVRTLCAHLRRDPALGLVGPVTNNIGNEAKIAIAYEDMPGMISAAGMKTRAHCGVRTPIRTAAFFCVAMRREVFEAIGGLDEAFGLGFFEDDDYCRRVERAGWSIALAEDVFVHHHLSASFDALKAETRRALFETNKAIYESKWGAWVPHRYRDGLGG